MEITAIRQQVRQPNRYSIYIDGKYSFSLSDTALLGSKLVPGQALTADEVAHFAELSAEDKLYGRVIQFLAIRPRSRWEIRQYLIRKKAEDDQVQQMLDKLADKQLIDDMAFAQSWVESRRALKPVSRRRLSQELQAKHIEKNIIDTVLRDDITDESMVLTELIEKKRRLSRYQDDIKLIQYLIRQGFSYDDIKRAIKDHAD